MLWHCIVTFRKTHGHRAQHFRNILEKREIICWKIYEWISILQIRFSELENEPFYVVNLREVLCVWYFVEGIFLSSLDGLMDLLMGPKIGFLLILVVIIKPLRLN